MSPLAVIDKEVPRLGAGDPSERNKAFEVLKTLLDDMDGKRDSAILKQAARKLEDLASGTGDAEVRTRIGELLTPLRKGAILWCRKELPGNFGFPLVFGDTLTTGGRVGFVDGWLGCFDLASGVARWLKKAPEVPGWVHRVEQVGDDLIAGGAGPGWLGRYDSKQGKKIWLQRELPGPALSLKVCSDRVAAAGVKRGGSGWIGCWEAGTGKEVWTRDLPVKKAFSLCAEQDRVFAGGVDSESLCWIGRFDLRTGAPAWERSLIWKKSQDDAGGVICLEARQNRLWAGGSDDPNHGQGGWIGCFDAETGKTVWEKKPGEIPVQNCGFLLSGGKVFACGDSRQTCGWIGCFEAGSGKLLWERRESGKDGHVSVTGLEIGPSFAVAGFTRHGDAETNWFQQFDLETGRLQDDAQQLPGRAYGFRFLEAGKLLAGGALSGAGNDGWMACIRLKDAWE